MTSIVAAISVYVPIRTESEMNMREHWAAKHRRKKVQQLAVMQRLAPFTKSLNGLELVSVKLTRYGKGKLDDDNLASSFKHVQDGVAKCLGIDDGKIKWKYEQIHWHDYKVRIHIKAA